MNEEKYSITTSNFRKIIYQSNIEIEENIVEIFKSIYKEINLRPYLNFKEAESVLKGVRFIVNSEKYMMDLKNKREDEKNIASGNAQKSNYIFTSKSSPKYHKNGICKTISNNFENFIIPEEVKNRGVAEVEKLRNFAEANKHLLTEGKEDVFIFKVKSQFNLKYDISKILFDNSGKIDISTLTHENIEIEIRNVINKIELIRETPEGQKSIKSYIYAPYAIRNNQQLSPIDLELLENKKNLTDLVMEFNIKIADGLSFSENLLQFYGFERCKVCF